MNIDLIWQKGEINLTEGKSIGQKRKNKMFIEKSFTSKFVSKFICFFQDKGGLTLETALVLPMVFFFLISSTYVLRAREAEILWKQAGQNVAEEAELMITLAGLKDMSKIQGKLLSKVPDFLQEKVRNKIGEILTERLFLTLQKQYFQDSTSSRKYMQKILNNQSINIEADWDKHYIAVNSRYDLNFIFFRTSGKNTDIISLWNIKDLTAISKENNGKEENKDSVWSESNFSRGKHFRNKYKANLPANFPDISYWDGNTVKKIMSLDLTAPYYKSDFSLNLKISNEMNKLAKYSGTGGKSPHGIKIDASQISKKEMLIVIPENTPEDRLRSIEAMLSNSGNIKTTIVKDQKSYRYINNYGESAETKSQK